MMAVLSLMVAAALGCGGGKGDVAHLQGAITLDGQPLPADATGTITFMPATGEQTRGASAPIAGGRYDSPETPQGAMRVTFSITQPVGPEFTTDRGVKTRNVKNIVPAKYGAGIDLEVTGDNEAQNFDLTK